MSDKADAPTADENEFRGRTAVITGAAGVIGGWIADAFARRGATLVLSDRRWERLEEARLAGRWAQTKVVTHQTELREPESIADLLATVQRECGAPDFLVNNAGIFPYTPLLQLPFAEWLAVQDVNVNAPFQLIKGVADLMIADGIRGSIVNIISSKAFTVSAESIAYSVSKAALAMLTRGSALALAEHGIRVNGVAPGFVPGSDVSLLPEDYIQSVLKRIPLQRASGPYDAPELVTFLCSERARFITGALIPADGGRLAGPITITN